MADSGNAGEQCWTERRAATGCTRAEFVRRWLLPLVACWLLPAGCLSFDRLRGPGLENVDHFGVSESDLARMRTPEPAGTVFGFSEKARATERRLGFR